MAALSLAIFFGLLAAAAAFDFLTFKIPNYLVITIGVLFVVFALARVPFHWFDHVGAGVLCLAAGIILYFAGGVGAGDVKLFAAVALWIGFDRLLMLLLLTSLSGLLVLLLLIGARAWIKQFGTDELRNSLPTALTQPSIGVPYGVAIAIGTVATALIAGM